MQINDALQQRHKQKSIDSNYTVHYTILYLTLHGIIKILAYMNLEPFYVIYTPLNNILKSWMTEHKHDHSWVTKTAELQ